MGLLSKIKNVLVDIGRVIIGKPSRKLVAKEKEIKGLRKEISARDSKIEVLKAKEAKPPRVRKREKLSEMWFVKGEQWVCDKSGIFPNPDTPEAEEYNCRWEVRKIAIGRGKPSPQLQKNAIDCFTSTFEPYSRIRKVHFQKKE